MSKAKRENDKNKQKHYPTDEMKGKEKAYREIFDWVSTFAQALFAVIIIFSFLVRFVTVQGESMLQTLNDGDRLIISDINYTPERGDIVVIHDPTEPDFSGPIIKRVIATEGETVTVDYKNKTITVIDINGDSYLMEEPYTNTGYCHGNDGRYYGECAHEWHSFVYYFSEADMVDGDIKWIDEYVLSFVVKEGRVFVCGDNRAHSLDSRYVGTVDERQILGKVILRIFPKPAIMNHEDYKVLDGKLVGEKQ